jgi:hypothetical protein
MLNPSKTWFRRSLVQVKLVLVTPCLVPFLSWKNRLVVVWCFKLGSVIVVERSVPLHLQQHPFVLQILFSYTNTSHVTLV